MSLKLKLVRRGDRDAYHATYEVSHSSDKKQTTLALDCVVTFEASVGFAASIAVDSLWEEDAEHALDNLAERLERMAVAIRERGPGPMFGTYSEPHMNRPEAPKMRASNRVIRNKER